MVLAQAKAWCRFKLKHGTLRFVSKLHFNRVSRIPERILVPAPHFNVVYSGQRRIPRIRFNDLLFMETIEMDVVVHYFV
jgi:hypothetical protein